jgi:hypothetical protein
MEFVLSEHHIIDLGEFDVPLLAFCWSVMWFLLQCIFVAPIVVVAPRMRSTCDGHVPIGMCGILATVLIVFFLVVSGQRESAFAPRDLSF